MCKAERPPEPITREDFLLDRHGKTFADVLDAPDVPFGDVLEFFSDRHRQQRMEDSEIHHDRAPLAGVVRALELEPHIRLCFETLNRSRSARVRQAIGLVVRMIMERRGWLTTGKKGSLGVRSHPTLTTPDHNTGGLSFWFVRAERYRLESGMPYRSVREACEELERVDSGGPAAADPGSAKGPKRKSGTDDPKAQ